MKAVCHSWLTTPRFSNRVPIARRRFCSTVEARQISQHRVIICRSWDQLAQRTNESWISIASIITKTKEKVKLQRAGSIWTIRCFHLMVYKEWLVRMMSREELVVLSQSSFLISSQSKAAFRNHTKTVSRGLVYTTTNRLLTNKIVLWSQSSCLEKRVTNVWWELMVSLLLGSKTLVIDQNYQVKRVTL
jgi:hypothetical protein